MQPGDWVKELRGLAAEGMDIVEIAEFMRDNHVEFRHRSLAGLNEFRVAFDLSIRQMQDIGGWYEGGVSAESLRSEIVI